MVNNFMQRFPELVSDASIGVYKLTRGVRMTDFGHSIDQFGKLQNDHMLIT